GRLSATEISQPILQFAPLQFRPTEGIASVRNPSTQLGCQFPHKKPHPGVSVFRASRSEAAVVFFIWASKQKRQKRRLLPNKSWLLHLMKVHKNTSGAKALNGRRSTQN